MKTDMSSDYKVHFLSKNIKHIEYFCFRDYKIDSDLNLGIGKDE